MAALPFPTFGTDQQGITPVQMQPAPIRFPTTRGGGTREIDPLAGIAPFALDYGVDFLFDKYGGPDTKATYAPPAPTPDYLDIEDYKGKPLTEWGYTRDELREEKTDPEVAEYLADQIFGPKVIPPKSKLRRNVKRAANLFAGLQFRDPSEVNAFIKSYGALNTGTVPDDLRRKWVGEYLKTAAGKNLDVQTAFLEDGSGENRSAIESPSGGFYIMSKGDKRLDVDVEGNAIPIGRYYENPRWIPGQGVTSDVSSLKNVKAEISSNFIDKRNLLEDVATALGATMPLITDLIGNKLESAEFDTYAAMPVRLAGEIKALINAFNNRKV